jgi:colanic acid/amylovoran biosynthesis glycosyltransferase
MTHMRLAYLLLHFPRLTETFVAEEIRCVLAEGAEVRIISLLGPSRGAVQAVSQELLDHTWYAPGLSTSRLWEAQLHYLFKAPKVYFSLLVELMGQPLPTHPISLLVKRLVIFLKAVAVAAYLEDTRVELVHAHFAWLSGGAAWVCARLLGVPFTVTVHAYDAFSGRNDLLPLVSRRARRVVAISEVNRSQVQDAGKVPATAIAVIHCGVDCSKFGDYSREAEARGRSASVKLLSVGSLVEKKGHRCLVEACELLRSRGVCFDCTIIGDGPEKKVLEDQIRTCGLEGYVHLVGARLQGEVIAAYRASDIFVLSATVAADGDRDGIPVVLMEAGASGLPLISTSVSGIPELVRHEETGLLVPAGDVSSLGAAIVELADDPAKRARLGGNARVLVESEFNIESNARRLASLFRGIVEGQTDA